MKKLLLPVLLALAVFSGCNKDDNKGCDTVTTTAPSGEVSDLRQYISSNGISAVEDSRGFFYTISNTGSGDHPTPCSNIRITYIGKLVTGAIFDQANNVSFNLKNLIVGWQEGLPMIGAGGTITLYLPPSLGYGASASGTIPANSILVFSIDLISIN